MKCVVCHEEIKGVPKEEEIPICGKKECIKIFVQFFGTVCKAVDEECCMDSDGFYYNKSFIRYDHFDEDFEKAWKSQK